MIYIGIMSNERYLCALFTMEWLWRVNQMLLGALSEVRVNSFYFLLFWQREPISKAKFLFHQVAF